MEDSRWQSSGKMLSSTQTSARYVTDGGQLVDTLLVEDTGHLYNLGCSLYHMILPLLWRSCCLCVGFTSAEGCFGCQMAAARSYKHGWRLLSSSQTWVDDPVTTCPVVLDIGHFHGVGCSLCCQPWRLDVTLCCQWSWLSTSHRQIWLC